MKSFFFFFSGHPEDDRTFLEKQTQGIKHSSFSVCFLTKTKIQATIRKKTSNMISHSTISWEHSCLISKLKPHSKIICHIIFIVEQFQISCAWGFFFRSGLLMSSKWVTKIPLMKWRNKYELWVCPPQWVTMLALEWRPEQAEFLFLPF